MSLFGGPRSTDAPPRLTDARVAFSVFTILIVVLAMALCRGPTGPRVLALQSMTVLPTAALPLATGGDDVPVAALLLLGLVLLQRRRPLWAGVALGVAASMKITAWPLAALAFLVARDRNGARGRRPSLAVVAGIVGVMIPAVLPTATENISAFIENVVRFPLGLAGVQIAGREPADRPPGGVAVPGHPPRLHRWPWPWSGPACSATSWSSGGRRRPAALSRLVGWVMTVAILLAPATRVGYLLYPVDFFVWAWLLRSEDTVDPPPDDVRGRRRRCPRGRRALERARRPERATTTTGTTTVPTGRSRAAPGRGGGRAGAGCSPPPGRRAGISPDPTPSTAVA